MSNKRLGKRLRQARKSVGLGVREMAREANVDYGMLSRVERGVTVNPTFRHVIRCARYLGLDLDELAGLIK